MTVPLDQHVKQKMQVYLGSQRVVRRIDLRLFSEIADQRIADYLFKHIKRRTFTTDDILILPETAEQAMATD